MPALLGGHIFILLGDQILREETMARSFVGHNKSRLSFTSYGVNSRGEVIPVTSFNLGFGKLSAEESNELSASAIAKARREVKLSNIKQLSYL